MKKKSLEKKLQGMWKVARKDMEQVSKDTARFVKKGEDYIREISKKGEENLETMVLTLQRERLYYDLGKSLASLAKNKWTRSKKAEGALIKIKNISRKIKRLRK